jgi:hypothetical protein
VQGKITKHKTLIGGYLKTLKIFLAFIMLLFAFTAAVTITSCSEDETITPPVDDTSVPKNLFPLIAGRVIVYGQGSLLAADTETPIPGSENGFESKWIVTGTSNLVPHPTLPVTLVLDTTKIPALGAVSVRTFFIGQDTVTGNFDFLTSLGFFYRSVKIYATPGDSASGIRADSLKWISLAKPSEGLDKEWTAFSGVFFASAYGTEIRLEILAKFTGKETLTIGGQAYESYILRAYRKVFLQANNQELSIGETAKLWLAPNVGPIKIILIGDAESPGKSQTMTAKNF